MLSPRFLLLPVLILGLSQGGCLVKKSLYDAALSGLNTSRQDGDKLKSQLEACETDSAATHATLKETLDALQAAKRSLEESDAARDALGGERDGLLAEVSRLDAALRKTGADVNKLKSRTGEVEGLLAEANRALEQARERQRAADARDAMLKELQRRLRSMIDAGQLTIRVVRGRLVVDVAQDVLFASGKSELSAEGTAAITQIAEALADVDVRGFQVEGHTDNVPIKTSRFPSNWELSVARAVAVVRLLEGVGVPASRLSAAGFGEFQPQADNDTPEGRAKNRRIEIVLLPDLQLLPDIVTAN